MKRAVLLAALCLSLCLGGTSAARLFNSKAGKDHPLKRQVGKLRRNQVDGKMYRKEVDLDHLGRAAFDPNYAHEEDLDAHDLGLADSDVHDPTTAAIEQRLKERFTHIDWNHDGVISVEELQRHLFANGLAMSRRRADAEFDETDTNHDGKVTAAEYLESLMEHDDPRREKVASGVFPNPLDLGSYMDVTRASFIYADQNHDGGLNKDEFFDFLNPEEGQNVMLKLHRLRHDLYEYIAAEGRGHEGRDAERPDGRAEPKMTFEQFYTQLWSQFTVWETHVEDESYSEEKERQNAMRRFVLLDTNADGYITAEELLPAFADLHPTENRYARMQAEHMMDMAECKDDRLTLEQMLKVPHAFYGAVHDDHDHSEL